MISGQATRLFDIFGLGPLMIYAATDRSMPGWARAIAAAGGGATIVNNLRNYMETKRAGVERRKSQALRFWNAAANGPFLFWYGARSARLPDAAKMALRASGVLTTVYNSVNYIKIWQEPAPFSAGTPLPVPE